MRTQMKERTRRLRLVGRRIIESKYEMCTCRWKVARFRDSWEDRSQKNNWTRMWVRIQKCCQRSTTMLWSTITLRKKSKDGTNGHLETESTTCIQARCRLKIWSSSTTSTRITSRQHSGRGLNRWGRSVRRSLSTSMTTTMPVLRLTCISRSTLKRTNCTRTSAWLKLCTPRCQVYFDTTPMTYSRSIVISARNALWSAVQRLQKSAHPTSQGSAQSKHSKVSLLEPSTSSRPRKREFQNRKAGASSSAVASETLSARRNTIRLT